MLVFRCTQRLAQRLTIRLADDVSVSTGYLGDWYANQLGVGLHRWVLCVSERSLLPVIIPARSDAFCKDFQLILGGLLLRLGIEENEVDREVDAAKEVKFAPTNNRQVLGVMNDFAWNAGEFVGRLNTLETVIEACLWLAETPSKPIRGESPERFTRNLFASNKSTQ